MLSRTGLLSTKLMQQNCGQGSNKLTRKYSKSQCSKNTGAKCPPPKKVCRIGPKPKCCHDPPAGYAPTRLSTTTFKLPPFIRPKVFRLMAKKEQLGPGAGKCECYKNPEYYSYHRYSYYELMMAANAVKSCNKCCT